MDRASRRARATRPHMRVCLCACTHTHASASERASGAKLNDRACVRGRTPRTPRHARSRSRLPARLPAPACALACGRARTRPREIAGEGNPPAGGLARPGACVAALRGLVHKERAREGRAPFPTQPPTVRKVFTTAIGAFLGSTLPDPSDSPERSGAQRRHAVIYRPCKDMGLRKLHNSGGFSRHLYLTSY
jgi:hypothetical protein